MPLRDHFRGWLRQELEWHSFHNGWAMLIAASLNARMPEGFRAAPNVQKAIEIDVAAYGMWSLPQVRVARKSKSGNRPQAQQHSHLNWQAKRPKCWFMPTATGVTSPRRSNW